jgi:hypothetical protein
MFDPNVTPPHDAIQSARLDGLALRCVEPHEGSGWKITAAGSRRASGICATQREAVWRATQIVANAGGGTVRIYDSDGRSHDYAVSAAPQAGPARKIYRLPRMTRQ